MAPSDFDVYFMQIAIREAERNLKFGRKPFGALVVQNGQVISQRPNLTDELQDPTAHAEIAVIKEASNVLGRKYLDDCTLYTTCEPCIMCLGAVLWAKIPNIVIGLARHKVRDQLKEKIYEDSKNWIGIHKLDHYPVAAKIGVLEEECLQLFEDYTSISKF